MAPSYGKTGEAQAPPGLRKLFETKTGLNRAHAAFGVLHEIVRKKLGCAFKNLAFR